MKEEPIDNKLSNFDSVFSPDHLINIEAVEQRWLTYDRQKRTCTYVKDFLIRDEFGQPL